MGESHVLNPLSASGWGQTAKEPGEQKTASFDSYLAGALEYVNDKQLANADITRRLIVEPDSVDIHDVTTALAVDSLSLEAENRIITQMISSWNEIKTTR
jgi:flagellar hook-basal body complex protein FliE